MLKIKPLSHKLIKSPETNVTIKVGFNVLNTIVKVIAFMIEANL